MQDFSWGIIGPGWIAGEFANDLQFTTTAKHSIGAVLGRTLESAKAFAEQIGAGQYFDNLEQFVKEAKVDAIYIASPHPLHYLQTIACMEHRKPVLCEKPVAVNSKQLEEMVNAARRNNTYLMEGMWIRFLPSITYPLSLLENNQLGKVKAVTSRISYVQEKDPENRFFNPELGGGSLLDLGSYCVYLAHLLLGKPETIKAVAALTDADVDKYCSFHFTYSDGKKASGYSTFISDEPNIAEFICENGTIMIGDAWNEKPSHIKVMYNDEREEIFYPEWEGRGFQFQIDAVCRDILEGRLENEALPLQLSLDMMNSMDTIREQTGIVYPYDAHPEALPQQ